MQGKHCGHSVCIDYTGNDRMPAMSKKTSNPDSPKSAPRNSGSECTGALAGENSPKQSNDLQFARMDPSKVIEIGGPRGPEPTRYGDWEKKGRCIDF